ncbi:MAG: 4-hydroxythreonine-4-phosphate dehydrogenase PdxA [Spirochaetales bacterium]|nr:4-hydroxythreonine-4-phosphate dehydrogenase PdxA [Spirochaetales bacterium]
MRKIAFMIGDPAGIGPEITVRCIDEYKERGNVSLVLVGDRSSFDRALDVCGVQLDVQNITESDIGESEADLMFLDVPVEGGETVEYGKVSQKAGACVYRSLKLILKMIDDKLVDGFVFAPFNKEAMKMGGCPYPSELDMFKDHFNRPEVTGEINYMDGMWTVRVSSHIAVKDIPLYVKKDRILDSIKFLDKEMQRYQVDSRRIAVAGLNPHCGEKGLFGTEEGEEIEPAVKAAQELGISAQGPFPADTIFLRVQNGEFDAIVSMYHDQGQIATKILGFDKGVTIHGSMPVAIATCAHGTAFDIAGTGKARPTALKQALKVVLSSLA